MFQVRQEYNLSVFMTKQTAAFTEIYSKISTAMEGLKLRSMVLFWNIHIPVQSHFHWHQMPTKSVVG